MSGLTERVFSDPPRVPPRPQIVANDDQPGVIGEVGTILGRHRVNIASFALGRGTEGAIGVVNVDEGPSNRQALDAAVDEIRRVTAIREAWIVRLS